MPRFASITIMSICLFSHLPVAHADEHWPQFRGANMTGTSSNSRLPESWGTDKNVVWTNEEIGRGWSSPIAWGDKIFVTGFVNSNVAKSRKGLYIQDLYGKIPEGESQWFVYCIDFDSGKTLWKRAAYKGQAKSKIHLKNSYASETPVTDGERVYAYFGNLGLFCYDMKGKLLWQKDLGNYPTKLGWGTAASPVLHDGQLYIVHDNEKASFLVALNAKTGKQLWKVDRKEKSNWATPFVWQNKKRTEIITCGVNKVRSYGTDGKLLWELSGMSSIVIPTPTASDELLYITSGYVGDFLNRPIFAIRPTASGNITLKKDETSNQHIAWYHRFGGPYHPSPLLYGGHLYILNDRGMLSCYDAKTGKIIYDRKRLPAGEFTTSPWAYNGKIFCQSEDGETFVISAGKEFEVLGRNQLDDMTLATPALVRDSLLLRTDNKLYRIAKTK